MTGWHTIETSENPVQQGWRRPVDVLATQGPVSNVMHIVYVRLDVELHIHTSPLSFS
jgi:hypothetical protein